MEIEEYRTLRALEDGHWWYRALRDAVVARLGGAVRILDVGCGTGGMMARLSERAAVGVDFSETALGHARARGIGRLVKGSACALPFRDNAFDAVLVLDVLSHRGVPDDALAVAECARVVRPGGTVSIHVPAYRWLYGRHDRAVHGARRYTRVRVGKIVRAAGLDIAELTYRNLPVLPLAAGLRLGNRCFRRAGSAAPARSDLRPAGTWVSRVMGSAARLEDRFLARRPLPAGLSILCVARKPGGRAVLQ